MGPLLPAGADFVYLAFTVVSALASLAGVISLVVIARQMVSIARLIRHK